jgi:phage/plasmid-associated DNA primase
MDGPMEYIKESSIEKTLIAGEQVRIRLHYQNFGTPVQTNALFVEGLNQEPKSRDKTYGLQRRLVRFWFPQTYPLNHLFKKKMLSERMIGALLALLIDHFVPDTNQLKALAPTASSQQMAVAHELDNTPAMQFIQALVVDDSSWLDKLEQGGELLDDVAKFMADWAAAQGIEYISNAEAASQLRKVFNTKRRSVRTGSVVAKVWVMQSPMPTMQALLDLLKETP